MKKNVIPNSYIVLIFCLMFYYEVQSQTDFLRSEVYTILNGHTINSIDEDRAGNMWIGSDEGLFKYDGTSMDEYENNQLEGSEIINLKCDTINDIVWVKSITNEIGFVCGKKIIKVLSNEINESTRFWEVEAFAPNKLIVSSHTNVYSFLIMNFKKIGCSLEDITYTEVPFDKQYTNLNPILIKKIKNKFYTEHTHGFQSLANQKTINRFAQKLLIDGILNHWNDHHYIVHDNLKITKLDTLLNVIEEFKISTNRKIIRAINDQNYLGLCGRALGIELFDLETRKHILLDELDNFAINDFFQDSKGILWFGTEREGLKKIILPQLHSANPVNFVSTLQNINYSCTIDSSVFFALKNGKIFKTINNKRTELIFECPEMIRTMKYIGNNHIAILGKSNTFIINNEGKLIAIKNDCAKDITYKKFQIFNTTCYGVVQIDINGNRIKKITKNGSRHYHITQNESLIYSTSNKGISYFSKEATKIITDTTWDNTNTITDIELDLHNQLWVATESNGIYLKKIGTDHSYRKIPSLKDLNKTKLKLIDNYLFLFTSKQLNVINIKTKKKLSINVLLGLPNQSFSDVSKLKNEFVLSSEIGIIRISVDDLDFNYTSKNTISVNSITVNGSTSSTAKKINLEYNYSKLEFIFSTQDFYNIRPINYFYKFFLDGELIRNEKISHHKLNLSNLRPGKYELQLSKSPTFFDEDNHIDYNINITQPFWERCSFIALSSLLLVSISIWGYKRGTSYINKKRINQEKIKKELDHLKLTSLQEKLSPHFINNILNTSQYYIAFASQKKASALIDKLSTLMRFTFDHMSVSSISLSEQLQFISTYIKLQDDISRTEIKFTIDTGDFTTQEIKNIMIPVYIVQPIIENSIKHNFGIKKLNIELSLIKKNSILYLEIKDDGKGIDIHHLNEFKSSLDIISKRLTIINGSSTENITFTNLGKLFIVTIKIKLNSVYLK